MPKIACSYSVQRRSKKNQSFILTLNPPCGLSPEICRQWQRRSFACLPPELAAFRNPSSKNVAKNGAEALIVLLKKGTVKITSNGIPLISYLTNFWSQNSEYVREQAVVNKTPLSFAYIENNRRNIRLHISVCPFFKKLPLTGLTRKIIRDYKLWAADERKMSGRLINQCLQTMSVAVRYAVANGELPSDPFFGTGKVFHKEKVKGVITITERAMLINAPITDYYARLSVLLGVLCGMRRGEIRGLLWDDIGDGIITIRHNYVDGDGAKSPKRKGGLIQENTRIVPMPNIIAEILNTIIQSAEFTEPQDFVIQSLRCKGVPVSAKFFAHALKRELNGIGLSLDEQKKRNVTFHSTRHSYVTLGRITGISDLELQAFAGHSAKMMEHYTHGDQVIDMEAARIKLEKSLLPYPNTPRPQERFQDIVYNQ